MTGLRATPDPRIDAAVRRLASIARDLELARSKIRTTLRRITDATIDAVQHQDEEEKNDVIVGQEL